MGIFFKPATRKPASTLKPRVQAAVKAALLRQPPAELAADAAAAAAIASAVAVAEELDRTNGAGAQPRWAVFVATALLLVVLLLVTVYVATAADAQPKDVPSSQLKTLSGTLNTAFTTLLGAIVGIITGEAVTMKS